MRKLRKCQHKEYRVVVGPSGNVYRKAILCDNIASHRLARGKLLVCNEHLEAHLSWNNKPLGIPSLEENRS